MATAKIELTYELFIYFQEKTDIFSLAQADKTKRQDKRIGIKMPKNAKVINELLELAKNTRNESVFQNKHQYKRFKAKTRTATIQDYFSITPLVKGLWRVEFYRECIYWCKKIIEENRLCDIWHRFFAFTIICLQNTSSS